MSVLEDLGGHGIGRTIHEPPSVPNTPDPSDSSQLHEGLVITVEPILGADGALAAHTEHTIVVTGGAPPALTR